MKNPSNFSYKIKKVPDRRIYFCQGRVLIFPAVPPWFMVFPHALQDTDISPATNVCLTSQNTRLLAFHCALCGPFDNLHFRPALTSPDSLWAHVLPLSPLLRFSVLNWWTKDTPSFLKSQLKNNKNLCNLNHFQNRNPDRKGDNRYQSGSGNDTGRQLPVSVHASGHNIGIGRRR